MRRACLIATLAVMWIGLSTATVSAQMLPGRHHGYYDGYGYDSATVVYNLSNADNATRYAAEANRAASQRAASQQMEAMQSGIRNTMGTDADRRSQEIASRQQSGRDWWFQVEQQQAAQRRAQPSSEAALVPGFEPASDMPPAARDIIKWQPVLCNPQFADQRAQIEAPYRRATKVPTAVDYQDMIDATVQMKVTLKDIAANVSAQEYLNAEAFLNQLATEARERLAKATPKK